MEERIRRLAQELATRQDEFNTLTAGEMTDEQLARSEALLGEIETGKTELERLQKLQERGAALNAWAQTPAAVVPHAGGQNPAAGSTQFARQEHAAPAEAVRSRGGAAFSARDGKTADERAYRFGQWFLATALGNQRSREYCHKQGIPLAFVSGDNRVHQLAHVETQNASGGFLVPDEFDTDMIVLREKYGVFRRNSKIARMRSDTKSVPRRTGGLTAYAIGDAVTITESTKGWDRVTLTARKIGVLAKYSSELDEDALIDMANDLADEISYAFAAYEDDAGFNGDGTSTYSAIVGVRSALKNLSGTIANIAGLVVASGTGYATSFDSIALADFNKVVGKLPQYASERDPRWFVHKTFYHAVMERLMLAAGGVTAAEVAQGRRELVFMGYPVEIAQKMPAVSATSQVSCLFGSLPLASKFGDRRQTTIAISEHLNFAEDELAIRGTERFDIVVHDVGNASATAALRVPGPIVGLITAAS